MFKTDDFFNENPIEPETIFEHKKPINADKFSVDALLENSVGMLFVKARIENDDFSQGFYKVEWTKQLEKESDRLSNLPGRSEFDNSRLERINKKISDFRKWANSSDRKSAYEPQIKATNNSKGKFEHAETTEWKAKAWELGETWMREQRQKGEEPGVIKIAKYVEGELSNQNITGRRGTFLDWETIKREALTGITGKPANGKGQKRQRKTGDSPISKSIPQQKTQ